MQKISCQQHPIVAISMLASLLLSTSATGAASSPQINDSGLTLCMNPDTQQADISCSGTGQDAESGRDIKHPNKLDGHKGFSFKKICNSGEMAGEGACKSSAAPGAGLHDWGCTMDSVTGLIWELKTTDGLLSDYRKTFFRPGSPSKLGVDTYVNHVNARGLCGANDWRLPGVEELRGLLNFDKPWDGSTPYLDDTWFPNTQTGNYWGAEIANNPYQDRFYVSFINGHSGIELNTGKRYAVRLVRKAP